MSTTTDESSYTTILQHRISFFFRGDNAPTELSESSIEHVEKLIRDGFNQGELCEMSDDQEIEFRGWWSIE